jgi:hypothetical protein
MCLMKEMSSYDYSGLCVVEGRVIALDDLFD